MAQPTRSGKGTGPALALAAMASTPADMRAALVPLMLDLANLSTLPTPVSDDELLARVVVATCSLVQTARNPSRPQAFLDALDHAGSEGDSFFALIQEIASSRQQKQAAASVPELLLAPTHVPEAVKTDDLEKVPEAVELKNPDHNSSSNGTEKTVKSNGSEENGGKDIVQPTAVPINSPPVVTRNSAIALAKEENSSLNVPHAKARALSSKRTAYSVSYPPH